MRPPYPSMHSLEYFLDFEVALSFTYWLVSLHYRAFQRHEIWAHCIGIFRYLPHQVNSLMRYEWLKIEYHPSNTHVGRMLNWPLDCLLYRSYHVDEPYSLNLGSWLTPTMTMRCHWYRGYGWKWIMRETLSYVFVETIGFWWWWRL